MAPVERKLEFTPPPGLKAPERRKGVVIVGAGPVGLAAAIELAGLGVPSVVLDLRDSIAVGSRAICWSKRSIEIFDRLGVGDRAVEKGVVWKVGRTYHRDRELFSFDLLPEDGHKRPAFINLQQYYVEDYLLDRALGIEGVDVRFASRVASLEQFPDFVKLRIETPDGGYDLEAGWLIACDGVRSTVRTQLGLEFQGEVFEDRFLISDISMNADFPSERRFWFEPTFHGGQSALLHKQPDNIYRIDLQLGPDADPARERLPENVMPRISKVVGGRNYRLEWVSVYTFQCRRLERFVHGRVIFAGDSAHVVSPFGARGGNGGIQDIDSLCWRLAAVMDGRANPSILGDYDSERVHGADENIANSSRTTRFMSPHDGWERMLRDQVLRLASVSEYARPWVNSGRLSVPCVYDLAGADSVELPQGARPGSVAPDAPIGEEWLIDRMGGVPTVLGIGCDAPAVPGARTLNVEVNDFIRDRYLGDQGRAIYLVRPDQVIAARWTDCGKGEIEASIADMWGGN